MTEQRIDPRDATAEELHPSYRVEFHERRGQAVDTWRLSERDVDEVLEWAERAANGRRVVVYVECLGGDELVVLRLYGDVPAPAAPGSPSTASG